MLAKNGLAGVLSALTIAVPATGAEKSDPASQEPSASVRQAAKSELIVKFTAGSTRQERQAAVAAAGGTLEEQVGGELIDAGVVEVDADADRSQVISSLERSETVAYAEPNRILHAFDTPNDPLFSQMWHLSNDGTYNGTPGADIHAPEAWSRSRGSCGVVVAITDTGIDARHPDLASNVWVNPDELPGNNIDDDRDGFVDDVHGVDFLRGDGEPNDEHGHGTHVAGTIGAIGNNGIGTTGVSQRAQLMALKFLDASGYGTTSDAIDAIQYAVKHGAQVINASWGGGGYEQSLRDVIAAAGAAGVTFVAAAGNSGLNLDASPQYPASFDELNIITVGASDQSDTLAGYSNYGASTVDIAAPGSDIVSTVPGGYASFSGTSMAAPSVSGVAALLLASNGSLKPEQIRTSIMSGSDVKNPFVDRIASNGRLNAAGALIAMGGPPGPDTSTECDGSLNKAKALKPRDSRPANFRLVTPKAGAVYRSKKRTVKVLVKWRPSKDSDGLRDYLVKVNGKTVKRLTNPAGEGTVVLTSPPTQAYVRVSAGLKRARKYRVHVVAEDFHGYQRRSLTTSDKRAGSFHGIPPGRLFYAKRVR